MFWDDKHTFGYLFINTLEFSKFFANISISQEMNNSDNSSGFAAQNWRISWHMGLFSDENVMNNILVSKNVK